MYSHIAFACLGCATFAVYFELLRRRHFEGSLFMGALVIAVFTCLGANLTAWRFAANAPLKEVKAWTIEVSDLQVREGMSRFTYDKGVVSAPAVVYYGFTYTDSAGRLASVELYAGDSMRIIEDEAMECGHATWTVYSLVVDEDWLFSGWANADSVERVVHEIRVGPDEGRDQ